MGGVKRQGFSSTDPFEEFENWVAKPIEAAITGAISGAITGVFVDALLQGACSALSFRSPSSIDPQELSHLGGHQPLIQSFAAGSTLEQARNFAVMYGVNSGISCVMKKLRGKEDVHTSMVAAFGSGVTLSLVTGMRGPGVMSVGVMFALVRGGIFKVEERLLHLKSKDKSRGLFSSIGIGLDLDHYALNVNNGLFFDNTPHYLLTGK